MNCRERSAMNTCLYGPAHEKTRPHVERRVGTTKVAQSACHSERCSKCRDQALIRQKSPVPL